jgi:predicted esterase
MEPVQATAPVTVGEILTATPGVSTGEDVTATAEFSVGDLLTTTPAAEAPAVAGETETPVPVASPTASAESAEPTREFQRGAILESTFIESVSIDEIDGISQRFYPSSNFVTATHAVDIYRVRFQSSNELGEPEDAQADLFIPRADGPDEFAVFVYAPGTTGIGNACPPSREAEVGRAWGGYRPHMLTYAGQGFIGVLPDGQNYDNPDRPHEYFISEIEAHVVLDSARAAYNFYATEMADAVQAQPTNAVFIAGYSNGGHMAFAAKDFAEEYAPELPIRGVISHGATTNAEILMQENPIFSPYLIYVYRHYYGSETITPEQVFAMEWLPTFRSDVLNKCVDEIFAYYSNDPQRMYNARFRTALANGQLAEQYPIFKAVLDANYAGIFGGFDIPVAFFQGTADYTVTPPSQERFATDLCRRGQPVTYESLPAVQHVSTRQSSFVATLEWMRNILAGETPRNDCGQIGE